MATESTKFFGFTRIGAGESISKDSYAATDADVVTQDSLLYAALTHTHDGEPALGDPTDDPALVVHNTGGTLPSGTALYYRVSFVDQYGLETAASPEGATSTPDPIDPPAAPVLTVSSSGGTLTPGSYSYVATFTDGFGGETTSSPLASVQVSSGTTNKVTLSLPDLPADAASFRIYRTKPGQASIFRIGETTSTTFNDTGISEDQTITIPVINSTMSANSVTVTIPGDFIPDGCAAWRIYRATVSGSYNGSSLVHHVVETTTDTSTDLVLTWVDTGADMSSGFPRETSATVPQGRIIDLSNLTGSLPIEAVPRGAQNLQAFAPGTIADSDVILITEAPADVKPVRVTLFTKTPPTTGTVRVRITDTASHFVEVSTATHVSGDPTGLYRKEFPLLEAAKFEAEHGTMSAGVSIDTELAASSGQAVGLVINNDMVTFNLGTLEPGDYHTFVKARVVDFDTTAPGDDLTAVVVRADTNATLGSASTYDLESTNPSNPDVVPADFIYQELTGPAFTAPGGVEVHLKVYKSTTSTQSYEIDFARYSADVPDLVAGFLTVETFVDSGPTDAANATVTVWF